MSDAVRAEAIFKQLVELCRERKWAFPTDVLREISRDLAGTAYPKPLSHAHLEEATVSEVAGLMRGDPIKVPTDHDYRLVRRLNDTEPKCATCTWWAGTPQNAVAPCERNTIVTLNLAVCTAWKRRRDGDDYELFDGND